MGHPGLYGIHLGLDALKVSLDSVPGGFRETSMTQALQYA